jgi:hypothetical protein
MLLAWKWVATVLIVSVTFARAADKPRLGISVVSGTDGAVLIAEVMVGFAADVSGLKPGDRVVRVGDNVVKDVEAFRDAVARMEQGATAQFTVVRDDVERVVPVTLNPPRPDAPGARPPTMPELADELARMHEKDQAARQKLMNGSPPRDVEQRLLHEMEQNDTANRQRLKEIIVQHGFPTVTMVGQRGADTAFLIVQHADRDREWQASMLPVLESLAQKGEASKSSVAYLTDRVLRAQGKPQLYGTQYYQEPGRDGKPQYVPPVVEDPKNLDKRRLSMGLEPWSAYEARMAKMQQREVFAAPRGPDRK